MKNSLVVIITCILISYYSFAQMTGAELMTSESMKEEMENKMAGAEMTNLQAIPVGNSVDPNTYFVGPGDVLMIKLIPQMINEKYLPVSPEGKVILPRGYGIVDINNLTLFETQKAIDSVVRTHNSNTKVSLSLFQSRVCIISISGNVISPGNYTLPATYRVSTAIQYANFTQVSARTALIQMPLLMNSVEREREVSKLFNESGISSKSNYASRNIFVVRKDGSAFEVDIDKAIATNDPTFDPCIKEGDQIFVPFDPKSYPVISIAGEVMKPTTLSFKEGDKVSMLVKSGAGLRSNADKNSIFLYKSSSSNQKIKLDLDDEMNLNSQDYDLEVGDVVIVGRKKTQAKQSQNGYVSIKGQVQTEGVFPISNNQTRVKDIIEMAGGISEDANLNMAYIARRGANNSQSFDLRRETLEYIQNSDLSLEDTTRFNIDMQTRLPFVSCDFKQLILNNSEEDNVVLKDGDLIVIPESPKSVYVFGRVAKPGYVEYQKGKPLSWYIDRAGGFATTADYKRTSVIRGYSRNWIEYDKEIVIHDGDLVYVPGEKQVPIQAQDSRLALIGSLVTGVIVLLNFVVQLVR